MTIFKQYISNTLASTSIPLTINGTPVLSGTQDSAYTGFTVTTFGGSETGYVYALVGTWPVGITINSSTGVISGTPLNAGTFTNLTVSVTDSNSGSATLPVFTIVIASVGGNTYVTQAVNFDGGTGLVNSSLNTANGLTMTCSYWIYNSQADFGAESVNIVWVNNPPLEANYMFMYPNPGGAVAAGGFSDDAGDQYAGLNIPWNNVTETDSTSYDGTARWRHVLMSFDITLGLAAIAVNGVNVNGTFSGVAGATAANVYNLPFWIADDGLGTPFTNQYTGNMADFWLNVGTSLVELDGTISNSNIAMFYNAGKPVDLGSDGSIPSGSTPSIFLKCSNNDPTTFLTNRGAGGNFIVNTGALTLANTSPTD